MATFAPQDSTAHNRRQCYCLNPACKHPENQGNALVCRNCGSNLLLQQRYRALKPIGQGGFGRTFLAVDESTQSQRRCVIKQFFPQQQGTDNIEKATELFRQEANRLETLGQHPQIPQLLAYFEQDDHQYLVQELIDGENLAQEIAHNGPFNETQIRQLLHSLLPVLRCVHHHQMIHRDIKPENIIRRRDNQLVLVDFGAAKYTTETMLGRTGTVIGSAAYTAPEQVKGKAIFASDLYSLGVTCIHLLTQIPPFDLSDTSEDTWVWRHYLRKPISKELGIILDKMLESGTKRRYQSADEVLKDLQAKSLPTRKTGSEKKLLVAGIAFLLLGSVGLGYLLPRAGQQASTPSSSTVTPPYPVSEPVQEEERQPSKPGGLFATVNGQKQVFPLKHTEVMGKVSGNVSRVEVTQTFQNPFKDPLEATYVFPLPDDAAVDDMEIKVGDRIIRGLIKKREEAKKIYEQAKQEGKTAGLLEQERDNIFTQSLANIKPGEKIDVTIRYTNSLKFEKGNYEFVFPMVVGPRYIPGTKSDSQGNTNPVKDASKITPPTIPTGRSGQDIGVTVEIEGGVPISNVRSPSHQISTLQDGRAVRIQLDKQNTIPNKDLIVRYQVAGNETQSTVLTQADERGGHFATYLIPAVQYQSNEIVPKDVVFLMDTSGSQAGSAIAQSKELMRRFINGLNSNDTFTIIDFASTSQQLSSKPLQNTPQNRQKALDYINGIDANGGSELMNGIEKVLSFPAAPEGRLRSVVLITDGLIGNDNEVIAEVQKNLKPGNRLYSFGVGSSVNRFLIDRIAEEGRGIAEVLPPDEPAQKVAEKFFRRINNPVLTNIEVSWEGSGKQPDIYPLKPADLFANQPLVLFGRKGDRSKGNLKIMGMAAGGKRYEKTVPIEFEGGGNPAIAQLWGRARIKELMSQMFDAETASGVKAVTDTALKYRLLSQYTAFVAVTEEVRVDAKGKRLKVQVPVETPEGMQADATAGEFAAVPEPSQIVGNLLALVLLGISLGWMRRKGLKSAQPRD
ncbi:protein kinase domain-containing protein [Allocoleopsis franciscana]|uniref:Serine/threonine protein kinase n=1 Tax=Allocoleopsis franciscana PCC 7113 TaxID=1173027 RepID=K9WBA9_9CYAN|nr:serine/threonine protein kinase [Allocoleopsis franciscana PCC 7113]